MTTTDTKDQSIHLTFCSVAPMDKAAEHDGEEEFPQTRTGILTKAGVPDEMGRMFTRDAIVDIATKTEKAFALYQHNLEHLIGEWGNFRVSGDELLADCSFDGITQRSRETYAQVAAGKVTGVSVGYKRVRWNYVDMDDDGLGYIIEIQEAELIEASICLIPLHADAMIASRREEYELERAAHAANSGKGGSVVIERLSDQQLRSLRTMMR